MTDKRLLRELAWILAAKLALLALLWWSFVRETAGPLDATAAAQHVVAAGSPVNPQGAPHAR